VLDQRQLEADLLPFELLNEETPRDGRQCDQVADDPRDGLQQRNDQIIARPGVTSFKQLKGKKVGLELTLVEHLLFLRPSRSSSCASRTSSS